MAEGRWGDDVGQGSHRAPRMTQKGGASAAAGVATFFAAIVGLSVHNWVGFVATFLGFMLVAFLFDLVVDAKERGAGPKP